MPDWNDILTEHAPMVWQTVCRIVPTAQAPSIFIEALLSADAVSQRDSVSNWQAFLQRCATARAISALHRDASDTLDPLHVGLASVSEKQALVFCLRYFSELSFAEIAMQTQVKIETIGAIANDVCTIIGRLLLEARSASNDSNRLADDLVEEAVNELRLRAAPALPAELLVSARDALAKAPQTDFEKPPVPTYTLALSIAVILMLSIVGGIWGYFTYRAKPVAMSFAEMLDAINGESSVSYHLTRNVRLPEDRSRKIEADITVMEPGRIRQLMEPPGVIVIWDTQAQKALTIEESWQRATLRDSADMFDETRPIDALALLKTLKPTDATFAGQATIQGRPAQGFKVNTPGASMSIWADVQSKLPIIMEMALPSARPPGDALMNAFAWGPVLDAAQFVLEPPEGYELAAIKVNLKPATEQDLVKALGIAAQLNGGKFPDNFDRAGLSKLTASAYKKLPARESADYRAAFEELEASLLQLGRGWTFIAEPKSGDDWNYAGQEALFGSTKPVLWYRPEGSRVYHIIDASLDIRPIQPNQLPTIPATKLALKPA